MVKMFKFTFDLLWLLCLLFTLKKVRNICDCENPRRTRARKVVNPPLKTAAPIFRSDANDFSILVPEHKSLQGVAQHISILQLVVYPCLI